MLRLTALCTALALLQLTACSSDDPKDDALADDGEVGGNASTDGDRDGEGSDGEGSDGEGSDGEDDGAGVPGDDGLTGGNSGAEGTPAPCERTHESLESPDVTSEILGLSVNALLDGLGRSHELPMRWLPQDSQPVIAAGDDTLTIELQSRAEAATASACDGDPDYPQALVDQQPPTLEVPITLSLATPDGRLDERLEGTLVALDATHASLRIELEADALSGTLGVAVTDFYTARRSLVVELALDDGEVSGLLMGPFSPHANNPCLYSAYAVWPSDADCEFVAPELLHDAAEQLTREFDLVWMDGRITTATIEIAQRETIDCSLASNEELSYANVDIHIATGDGAVDLTLPGYVSGSPVTADMEAESDATARLALTADELFEHFGYEGDADAGLVELYLSSLNAIGDPPFVGGLEVLLLDRSGLPTTLPEGNPGGAPRCFDAGGRPQTLMRATLGAE